MPTSQEYVRQLVPRVGATVLADFVTSEEPRKRLVKRDSYCKFSFLSKRSALSKCRGSLQLFQHLFNIRVGRAFQPVASVGFRKLETSASCEKTTGHENCFSYLVHVCDVALSRIENVKLLFDERTLWAMLFRNAIAAPPRRSQ